MKLKIQEIIKKKGWLKVIQSGLAIAVVADDEHDVPADLVAPFTQIILKWRKKRREKGHMLSLTFSGMKEMHKAIEAAFFQLYKREPALSHILDRMTSISITLCDEQGTPVRSYLVDPVGLLHGRYRPLVREGGEQPGPQNPSRKKGVAKNEKTEKSST